MENNLEHAFIIAQQYILQLLQSDIIKLQKQFNDLKTEYTSLRDNVPGHREDDPDQCSVCNLWFHPDANYGCDSYDCTNGKNNLCSKCYNIELPKCTMDNCGCIRKGTSVYGKNANCICLQ
jgi:hypothetical protein